MLIILLPLLASCAAMPPYRTLLRTDADCNAAYARAQWNEASGRTNSDAETQRIQKEINGQRRDPRLGSCWLSASERHAAYDLYAVEFDDEGWLAGTASNPKRSETQMTVLMRDLQRFTHGQGDAAAHPLSIIVFTHGWHHSAAPNDSNVIAFRRLLEQAAAAERELCLTARGAHPAAMNSASSVLCSDAESAPIWQKKRRVVGVYVGWRGDSVIGPIVENGSIWDRKLTAETVALGSVQELFARLHSFYVEHECHGGRSSKDARSLANCADVRLLMVGHSFGGLITYRALAPRLTLGIVETGADDFDADLRYAYGFGDLTVLINPAFEATRFESLAQAAAVRRYVTPDSGRSAQLPVLIVATSESDWATGVAFPIFRWMTTRFEHTQGAEGSANIHAVGWEKRYRTHRLVLSAGRDVCGLTEHSTPEERWVAEAKWSEDQRRRGYAGFGDSSLELCDGLELTQQYDWALARPPYLPLWVMQTNRTVIDGHNDFLNVHFVDFVRQVYYTILREEDLVMRSRIEAQ